MAREHQTSRGITALPESGRSLTAQKGHPVVGSSRSDCTAPYVFS
jgi:hypothetical protein